MVNATRAQIEVAERAVRTFNKMLPTLEGFAQALTGKPMSVVLSKNGSTYTDGKVIYVTVPYEIGVEGNHERAKCDYRDDDGVPLCPACDDREKLLALVYHEISHVAFRSFTPLSPFAATLIERMDSAHAKEIAAQVRRHLSTTFGRDTPKQVAATIQEYLPMLTNVFEDIRVDARMRDARPGTFYIQQVLRRRLITSGSHDPITGQTATWAEKPLNAQASVACIAFTEGDPTDIFDPFVIKTFKEDAKLQAVLDRAHDAVSVDESFANAVEALIRLQQHGFFDGEKKYEEPEPEPEEKSEPESEESSEEKSDESESNNKDGDESGDGDDPVSEVREPEGSGEDRGADGGEPVPEQPEGGSDGGDGAEQAGDDDSPADESSSDGESDDMGEEEEGDGVSSDVRPGDSTPGDEGSGAGSMGGEDGQPSGGDDASDAGESDGSDGGSSGASGSAGSGGHDSSEGEGGSSHEDVVGDDDKDAAVTAPAAEAFGGVGDAEEAVTEYLGHDDEGEQPDQKGYKGITSGQQQDAIEKVIGTFEYFETPSSVITGVNEYKELSRFPRKYALDLKSAAPEGILGPSLLHLRAALEENKRSSMDRNRRSGRVNARVLGRRAWNDDDRLFQRKVVPGKRDYAFVIGIDVSGSTSRPVKGGGTLCDLAVKAAYAQAELCSRLGIKFAVYAHSGTFGSPLKMEIYVIKDFDSPWDTKAKARMSHVDFRRSNLDGHTIEYYRKAIERVQATDKTIMYYSDGAMPAENYAEELEVLKREIATCKKKNITLMAVGVMTDDPEQHGLDTARLDSMADIPSVVKHLGKRIAERSL